MLPVDIDDPTTWPPEIYRTVADWADSCDGSTTHTTDLPLSPALDDSFRESFRGILVRAYHYTRLLPHERQLVLSEGLRPLSARLLHDRIESARLVGAISAPEAAQFHEAHVFAAGEQKNREGRVCLVLSRRTLERDLDGCLPLLTTWGGEGLYRSSRGVPFRERFRTLGSPAAVVALLDLSEHVPKHLIFPGLYKAFVGSLLRLDDARAEVHYFSPVPPEHIERIEEVPLG